MFPHIHLRRHALCPPSGYCDLRIFSHLARSSYYPAWRDFSGRASYRIVVLSLDALAVPWFPRACQSPDLCLSLVCSLKGFPGCACTGVLYVWNICPGIQCYCVPCFLVTWLFVRPRVFGIKGGCRDSQGNLGWHRLHEMCSTTSLRATSFKRICREYWARQKVSPGVPVPE